MRELFPSSERIFGSVAAGFGLLFLAFAADWVRRSAGLGMWTSVVLGVLVAPVALFSLVESGSGAEGA